jgi:ArsR family transcriptional regulator
MNDVLNVAKALADANRLRALMALGAGELCVCQLIEMLGLAPSTVSKHLSILHQAGLVEVRKEGRWMYYRLPGRGASKAV